VTLRKLSNAGQARFRRAEVVAGSEQVAVVDGYLSDRVFLLTRFSGDVDLGPADALRLGRALLLAGARAALRSRLSRG